MEQTVINAAEATERLRAMGLKISPETVRDGIEQGQFPFGVLIRKKSGTPVCYVFPKKLQEWAQEMGVSN